MTTVTRRQLGGIVGLAGIAATGLWIGGFPGVLSRTGNGALVRSGARLPDAYTLPFRTPPLATGTLGADGVQRYELEQRTADVEVLPGLRTRLLTYAGSSPGPTLVSRTGRPTQVTVRNGLTVPTVTHLHGGHTPAGSDGYPTDLLLPAGVTTAPAVPGMASDPAARVASGSRTHTYPMQQRAAMLWYHDHAMAATAQNVWRGLFGLHLVHDDEEEALGLPSGDRDLPVVICDRSFAADGSLLYPPVTLDHGMAMVPAGFQDGVLGDVTLVNGVPWPVAEVPAVRHRLRLLNASNARAYRLSLWPPPPGGGGLVQVGSDGGLLETPVAHDALDLAPGERYDVVVDLGRYEPGTAVDLVNELEPGMRAVMRFRVGRRLPDDSRVPDRLSTVERLDPGAAVVRRSFDFRTGGQRGPWTINAGQFDPARVDAAPTLGAVEVWTFTSDVAHPVHVHLDPFQVVSRGAPGRLSRQDVGWKDTVAVRPSETVEVAVRFTDYPGRYVVHCHNLEHEDMAMMANVITR
jgi:spore coat protein A